MASIPVAQNEIWRSIPLSPGYEVSDAGRVRSVARRIERRGWRGRRCSYLLPGKVLRQAQHGKYVTVTFSVGGRRSGHYVHRLVLEAFVGPGDGKQACHKNGQPRDNRLDNLRWGTAHDNACDRKNHGSHLCGERQNGAKLKEEDIRAIRRMVGARCPYKYLTLAYGVSWGTISMIASRKTWGHVE